MEVKKDAKETVACVNSSSACSFGTIVRTSYRNDRETAEKEHCSNVKQSDSGTTSERALGRRCNAVSRINGSTNKKQRYPTCLSWYVVVSRQPHTPQLVSGVVSHTLSVRVKRHETIIVLGPSQS